MNNISYPVDLNLYNAQQDKNIYKQDKSIINNKSPKKSFNRIDIKYNRTTYI